MLPHCDIHANSEVAPAGRDDRYKWGLEMTQTGQIFSDREARSRKATEYCENYTEGTQHTGENPRERKAGVGKESLHWHEAYLQNHMEAIDWASSDLQATGFSPPPHVSSTFIRPFPVDNRS